MEAVLAQLDKHNNEKSIAFFSKRLSDSQKKYAITKQEMLALVSAISHSECTPVTEGVCEDDNPCNLRAVIVSIKRSCYRSIRRS